MHQQFPTDKTEESLPPQLKTEVALETTVGIETETDTLTAQNVTERLNDITKRGNNARRAGAVGALALFICIMRALSFIIHKLPPASFLNFLFIFLSIAIYVFALRMLFRKCSQAIPKFDASEIAKLGGVKAVVPLLIALQVVSEKQRPAIHAALTTLLPQMKATDAHLLTSDAHRWIRSWLGKQVNTVWDISCPVDLRVAALEALEQVGNTDDIPVVERLANIKARTPAQMRVKQAAIECLPMLRDHCGEVASAQTLLRASNAEDLRPDSLLRAASDMPATTSAELLRGAKKP